MHLGRWRLKARSFGEHRRSAALEIFPSVGRVESGSGGGAVMILYSFTLPIDGVLAIVESAGC